MTIKSIFVNIVVIVNNFGDFFSMEKTIAIARGDGVGSEVIEAAVTILNTVAVKFGHSFNFVEAQVGGSAIDATGSNLPAECFDKIKSADALLLGPLGGTAYEKLASHLRPERALPSLINHFNLFVTISPVVLYEPFIYSSNIHADAVKKGLNLVVVQDALGIKTGNAGYRDGKMGQEAYDTTVYSISEIERLARFAFDLASARVKKVASIDKADSLDSHKLWNATVKRIAKQYKGIKLETLTGERALERLIQTPASFDVVLAPNLLGSLFTASATSLASTPNLAPVSHIGATRFGIYTVGHGAQEELKGTDTANPIAAILAASMMLSASFNMHKEMFSIENAVKSALKKGLGTMDLPASKRIGCQKLTEEIALRVLNNN